MKKPFLERSTIKWILAWFGVCCLFSIIVIASELTSFNFSRFRISWSPAYLEVDQWNNLVSEIEWLKNRLNTDLSNNQIPEHTVIIYNWSKCPDWWKIWKWHEDGRFLMPLQSEGSPYINDWSWSFVLVEDNLPAHSHYLISDGLWHQGIGQEESIALGNSNKVSDSDYNLAWSAWWAIVWKSSSTWKGTPVTFTPKYTRVLFCEKCELTGCGS
jgi:hypothetical protein